MEWRDLLLEDDAAITKLLANTKRVAVLGIKTEEKSGQPSFYVPQALQRGGLSIIPVPVYHADATEILGEKVYRTLAEIPGEIDMVDVFRKPADLAGHLDDILAAKPKSVWLQAGIRDDAFAEKLAKAGIAVVQDRCLMVEYRRRHG